MEEALETFDLLPSRETIEPSRVNEGTNAVRFAMLASLPPLTADAEDPESLLVSSDDLEAVGLNPDLASLITLAQDPHERLSQEAKHFHRIASNYLLGAREEYAGELSSLRYRSFGELNEGDTTARLSLLAAGLGSGFERESATAASAILSSVPDLNPSNASVFQAGWPYRFLPRYNALHFAGLHADFVSPSDEDGVPAVPVPWDSDGWERYVLSVLRSALKEGSPSALLQALRFLAQVRVDVGQQSGDPIVRELSYASYLNQQYDAAPPIVPTPPADADGTDAARLSTIVHGTFAWKGDWWYPKGDFHTHAKEGIRGDLYSRGQSFSWSGRYSESERKKAGKRFADWAKTAAGATGLHTVFAHSYGGEVVARAVNAGTKIDEVVLLSAPINDHHEDMVQSVGSVIDVRLKFDIVLLAARAHQRFRRPKNVTALVLNMTPWSHTATHSPQVWKDNDIAKRTGLI